jgi:predicted ester cyclase
MLGAMTAPTQLERFFSYVRAFELAYLTDDWRLLEPHFTDGCWHTVAGGGPFGDGGPPGRANAIAGLRKSVHDVDRRFDVRIPHILAGPVTRPDGVWMRFGVTLRRAGLPDLFVTGDHLVVFDGGRIAKIEETLPPDVAGRVAAYLAQHDAALRPAGSQVALPLSDANRRDLEAATMQALARCYGAAKSEQDVGAALSLTTEDFALETVSFGVEARDRKEAELQLIAFFRTFPDYGVTLDGIATAEGVAACWGTARLTFAGDFMGHAPTGRTAELPIFCTFDFANGSLRRERFFFDAATLCEQIGLPHEALDAALAPLRRS